MPAASYTAPHPSQTFATINDQDQDQELPSSESRHPKHPLGPVVESYRPKHPAKARAVALVAGLAGLALLAVARTLTPADAGIGTHQQLGLPPCSAMRILGIPCPTCFLTRSVMASLHGDLGEALELHVFGPPSVVGLAWIGWRQGVRGHSLPKLTPRRAKLLGMVIAALLIYWLARLWGWLTLGWPQPA